MRFSYVYKTSDGVRHTEWIDAPSREEVFQELRKIGIRPIKVIAVDGSKANGEIHGIRRRVVVILSITCVFVGAAVAFLLMRGNPAGVTESYNEDEVKASNSSIGEIAKPMTRRQFSDDAKWVRFKHPSESFLARYARPGVVVEHTNLTPEIKSDFQLALDDPIFLLHDELPACKELKRIVAGMKEELRVFLDSDGTLDEYILRLEERQKMEASYREQAKMKLLEVATNSDESVVFQVWKDQNRWLGAMGIERLPPPDIEVMTTTDDVVNVE